MGGGRGVQTNPSGSATALESASKGYAPQQNAISTLYAHWETAFSGSVLIFRFHKNRLFTFREEKFLVIFNYCTAVVVLFNLLIE